MQYGMTCMRHGFFGSPTARKVLANEQIAPSGAFCLSGTVRPKPLSRRSVSAQGVLIPEKPLLRINDISFTYVNINKMPAEVSCRHEKFSLERNGVLP